MRDGGTGLAKGVALVNEERQEQGQNPLTDQGDHFHAARHGGVGMNKAQRQVRKALAAAEAVQKELDEWRSARAVADGDRDACQPRVEEGGTGDGYLART